MPSLSPSQYSPGAGEEKARPSLAKRHSSNSAQTLGKNTIASPDPSADHIHHNTRHATGKRHAKFAIARGHGSRGNLVKYGRQAANLAVAEENKKHNRHRSHEADTEIRLPGSLDESRPVQPPPMRRNNTSYQLPRAASHVKLKKNHSHGALTRLNSTKNMSQASSGSQRTPMSPSLKGKARRHRSDDLGTKELDLHEQEVELLKKQQERKEPPKKVGFAVGESSDEEDAPEMEGSGLQEDEWTEESTSASPYSTRQNTANNSRRASVVDHAKTTEKPGGKHPFAGNYALNEIKRVQQEREAKEAREAEEEEEAKTEDSAVQSDSSEGSYSPRSSAPIHHPKRTDPEPSMPTTQSIPTTQPSTSKSPRSPLAAAKQHPNPTNRMLSGSQLPAPALISQVSAMDDGHSGSPSASMQSSRSNAGEGSLDNENDLVSRFMPSTSHPSIGSGGIGSMGTPKDGSFKPGRFYAPEEESTLPRVRPSRTPASPGSTVSASSGVATPAIGRSRIELRMLGEKALAEREEAAEKAPNLPHHIYDRRNETLKSYLNLAASGGLSSVAGISLGPEIFQGRFKAINTELKVVQRFRDPVGESVDRMKSVKGTKIAQKFSPQKSAAAQAGGGLKGSRSAVSLLPHATAGAAAQQSKLSTSMSPPATPQGSGGLTMAKRNGDTTEPSTPSSNGSVKPSQLGSAKSAVQIQNSTPAGAQAQPKRAQPRRGVSFAGTPPETREMHRRSDFMSPVNVGGFGDGEGPDAIARMLWTEVG